MKQMGYFGVAERKREEELRNVKVCPKWVDELKMVEDRETGEITEIARSRLVAMQFNTTFRDDTHKGTPPIKCLRILLSCVCSKPPRGKRQLARYDCSHAFFHADMDQRIALVPPRGAELKGCLSLLLKALCGTRRDGFLWQELVANVYIENGFVRVKIVAQMFYHPIHDISALLHGDDVLVEGLPPSLDWLDVLMTTHFVTKVLPRIGPGAGTLGTYLKRVIKYYQDEGYSLEGDSKHPERLLRFLGLEDAKPAETPWSKATGQNMRDGDDVLPRVEAETFQQGDRPGDLPAAGPLGPSWGDAGDCTGHNHVVENWRGTDCITGDARTGRFSACRNPWLILRSWC